VKTDSDHLTSASTQGGTVRERPILFSAPMVRALLAGAKSQTRRALRVQPDSHHWESLPGYELKRSKIVTINERCAVKFSHSIPQNPQWDTALDWLLCPYGQPGDRLWVRESHLNWWKLNAEGTAREFSHVAAFRADGYELQEGEKWIPSIHMLRAASRITLEITDVRVERLQAISDADAAAEGCPCYVCGRTMDGTSEDDCHCFHRKATASDYRDLWESINGAGSWEANPWVWAVSFERCALGETASPNDPNPARSALSRATGEAA
jgi:hypothetical protein